MKSQAFFLLTSAIGLLLVILSIHDSPTSSVSSLIWVLVEPEAVGSDHPRVVKIQGEEVSAGGFIRIRGIASNAPDYGRRIVGELSYPFTLPRAGRYHLWIRAKWSGVCANSVTILLRPKAHLPGHDFDDNQSRFLVGNDQSPPEWHWVPGPVVDLQSGEHEILMGTRESGAEIDCILLTSAPSQPDDSLLSPASDPPASEPARSNEVESTEYWNQGNRLAFRENFAEAQTEPGWLGSNWKVDRPEWFRSPLLGLPGMGPAIDRVALAEARVAPFTNGYIRCGLYLTPHAGAGLFFRRNSEGNYYLVRLAAGASSKPYANRLQLCHVDPPTIRVLKEQVIDIDPYQPVKLELWSGSDSCQLKLDGRTTLSAKLALESEGRAGLWVDGVQERLLPYEVLGERNPISPNGAGFKVRTEDQQEGLQPLWPGVMFGLSPQEAIVARWTNLSQNERIAKRIELVRIMPGGRTRVLDQKWGIFTPEICNNLTFQQRAGKIQAWDGDRAIVSAAVPVPASTFGLVFRDQPKAVFCEFALETFEGVAIDMAGSQESHRSTLAGPDGITREWLESPLCEGKFFQGMISIPLRHLRLPCGFSLFGNDSSKLWIIQAAEDEIHLAIRSGTQDTNPWQATTKLNQRDTEALLHIVYSWNEILIFLDDDLLLLGPRPPGRVGPVSLLRSPGQNSPFGASWSEFHWNHSFEHLGPAMRARDVTDRVAYGDIMLRVHGSVEDLIQYGRLQIHGRRSGEDTGYWVDFDSSDKAATWRLYRKDRVIGSGPLAIKNKDKTTIDLVQEGSAIYLIQDGSLLSRGLDPAPMRQGFLSATRIEASEESSLVAMILRSWDTHCDFSLEQEPTTDAAIWRFAQGNWKPTKLESGRHGFLVGATDSSGRAFAYLKEPLDTSSVLVELKILPQSLKPNTKLMISFFVGDDSKLVEEISISKPDENSLQIQSLRNDKYHQETAALLPGNPYALALTILRTEDSLSLTQDMRQVFQRHDKSPVGLDMMRIGILGESGSAVAFRTLSIQRNPLAGRRVPKQLRDFLDFVQTSAFSNRSARSR